MAKAGSCKTGLISAPLRGAIGKIVWNGFEVMSKKSKNPTRTIEIMPTVFDFRI